MPIGSNAKSVLFTHAAGFCAEVWRPVLAELSTLARRAGQPEPECRAIDLPGHGKAQPPPPLPLMQWQTFEDAALSAAADLGGGSGAKFGVGHSLGGTSLVLAELARPGTFDALLLFEPIIYPPWVPPGRREDNPIAGGTARRRNSFASLDAAREYFVSKPLFARWDPRSLEAYMAGGLRAAEDGSLVLQCEREFEADIYRSDVSGIWDRLPNIGCPVYVWCGGASHHMDAIGPGGSTTELYRQMAAKFGTDGASFEPVDGLGHFGPLEDPARFASSVWTKVGSGVAPRSKL